VCALALAAAGCAATEYKVAQAAAADGSILSTLHLGASDVKYQAPCIVAVKRQVGARPLACVYVQTETEMHFLRFNEVESRYVPAVSVALAELTSVALARYGLNRQVQVNRKGEMLAFHIVGSTFVNSSLTEEIFSSLIKAGIAQQEPERWIELADPVPMPVTIPVYVGH